MKIDARSLGWLLAHLLFWGWNGLFVLSVFLGLGPTVFLGLGLATVNGFVPWHITAFALAMVILPVLGMGLGAWKLWRDPGRLLSLFYGVQAPLMLLCAVRLFAFGALTPATGIVLLVVGVGCLGLLRTLLSGPSEETAGGQGLRQVAQTVYLGIGLWWGALATLYALPLGVILAQTLFEELTRGLLWREISRYPAEAPLALTLFGLAGFTVVALLTLPAAMLGISLRAWELVHRRTVARLGRPAAWGMALATLGLLLTTFGLTSRQPQHNAFRVLQDATTDAQRRAALADSDRIRVGLLNARLAETRYLTGDPEGEHVHRLWTELIGETLAVGPQQLWRGLTTPFVYRPVHDGRVRVQRGPRQLRDRVEAERAYADFFDRPMGEAEREALVAAAGQTWSWRDAQAGLLDVGEQRVWLERQDVVVERIGDLATVSIHDVYRNRTWDDQEVRVAFTLPEGAAPAGLWLGHTEDRDAAFRYVVAPRGAAQEVYEQQVRRRVDPALLEQVGPRQYRLRAFPVPAREGNPASMWSMGSQGPELHLWLDLVVPLQDGEDGAHYPLPQVTEVRNLFWDRKTARTLDGRPMDVDAWVPERVVARRAARTSHRARIGAYEVRAEPAGPVQAVRRERITVLVDGTRSMDAHAGAVDEALARLRGLAREVEVLCTVEQRLRRCDDFRASEALFWGSEALERRLVEAAPLARRSEALVVLTDAGSYELAAAAEREGLPDAVLPPLWLVHLGGMPVAYPDWTADRLQRTGGGAVESVDALQVAWADPAVVDGWRWTVEAVDGQAPVPTDPFGRMAAKRLVAHLDQEARAHGLDLLDTLHEVAVGAQIVTPYSSMIVLVNDAQRKALADAEEREDRFDREIPTDAPVVTAAPEPGTWLLLALGGGAMAGLRRRQRLEGGEDSRSAE